VSAAWIEIGRIGSPFGVKGWMRVESFVDPPERLFTYRQWDVRGPNDASQTRTLLEGREHGESFIARLEGIEDRDAAALLQGSAITVARSTLPPLKEREHYQADLLGLAVRNLEGVELGVLRHFVDTPGGTVMVVRNEGGREHWVPATPQHLNRVDLTQGRVVVDWPEDMA
jgi:16S rRNA processing protein RimM